MYYLIRRRRDLPADPGWLSDGEAGVLAGLKVPKRRADWLLGRWTAKSALSRMPGAPGAAMHRWEIRARDDGSPSAWLEGREAGISLSISHSHGMALCTLAQAPADIGCDLERVETRSPAFETA